MEHELFLMRRIALEKFELTYGREMTENEKFFFNRGFASGMLACDKYVADRAK